VDKAKELWIDCVHEYIAGRIYSRSKVVARGKEGLTKECSDLIQEIA